MCTEVRLFAMLILTGCVCAGALGQTDTSPATEPASAPAGKPASASAPSTSPATAAGPKTADAAIDPATRRQYDRGLELIAGGNLLQARDELSEAFFSGRLDEARKAKALSILTEISDKTLLSTLVYEDDPYTSAYEVARGDLLQKIVEREKLMVSPAFIARLSRVDASRLQVGLTLKLLRGPVHAVVSKSDFTMDLYLQRPGGPKAFLKRLKVGLGKDDGTPEGSWIVAKKASRARWTPPATAGVTRAIAWGEEGYPLGRDGYWIALQGTDENTRTRTGYGLHGTNEPESIGKAASLGCVRLADDDIELVYWLMAEKVSTVTVVP